MVREESRIVHGRVFGVSIDSGGYDTLIAALLGDQASEPLPRLSVYSHFFILLLARRDPRIHSLLNDSTVNCLDGIGTWLALRFLGEQAEERMNATDYHARVMDACLTNGMRAFFLGADAAVNAALIARYRATYPGAAVTGHHGRIALDDRDVLERISRFNPDLLVLGMGVPRQFDWLLRHRQHLDVPLIVMTGGYFDFAAGTRSRAPQWMRRIGLEWLHRLLHEPRRLWRRYLLGIPVFIIHVLREKLQRLR